MKFDAMLYDSDCVSSLERYLCEAWQARSVHLHNINKLDGGAIQENWGFNVEIDGGPWAGQTAAVLRTDASSVVSASMSRMQEYAVLKVAYEAGVLAPEPLLLCDDVGIIGRRFYLMRRLHGVAAGHRLVRDAIFQDPQCGDLLVERLGEELARIHQILPPQPGLEFLLPVPANAAQARIDQYRAYLDALDTPQPFLEWSLCWLEDQQPKPNSMVLCHSDYRTGNYLVEGGQLTGILDWEFSSFSDPDEDLGWFCARCWRFGQRARQAGGIGTRRAFYRGYTRIAERELNVEGIPYWEIMATVRWSIIALQQGQRCLTDRDQALELALTGQRVAELELDILEQIQNGELQC